MGEYSSKQLAVHLVVALATTLVLAAGFSGALVFVFGGSEGIAFFVGALIIAAPQAWLAISLFSRFAAAPTLLGIGKFGMSAVLFAVWFSVAAEPAPQALFAGAMLALITTPIAYYRQGRR